MGPWNYKAIEQIITKHILVSSESRSLLTGPITILTDDWLKSLNDDSITAHMPSLLRLFLIGNILRILTMVPSWIDWSYL